MQFVSPVVSMSAPGDVLHTVCWCLDIVWWQWKRSRVEAFMNKHLKTLVLIFKRFSFSPYLSLFVSFCFLRHKNVWTLRHKSLESAKRKNGIKMVRAQKWAPRSHTPCLEQWSTCGAGPASHVSLQEAGPFSQADLMSSHPRTMSCSPGHWLSSA